jgi:NAD(P)-dependent dehydrogenase (short-subunit alcohol dehydrogenase family)
MHLGLVDVDADGLAQTAAAVGALGARSHVVAADVSDRPALFAAADELRAALGPVAVVCNNAGVGSRGPILEMPDANFDWLFAVNVTGVYNVVKAFVPEMVRRGEPGHMVVTVSVSGLFETPAQQNGVYGATKLAVFGLARYLRAELEPRGIGVTALVPGMVRTNSRQNGRSRPARFGGPFDRPDSNRPQVETMSADEVGAITVRAIHDDDFLAVTHPADTRRRFLERQTALLAEIERWDEVVRELGIDATLPALPV